MTVTLSDNPTATSIPIVSDGERHFVHAWRKTGLEYRGGEVYQSLNDGHLAYEVDSSRLVALPEDVEEAFLSLILQGLITDDGVN